jgi:hypothetical protein
VHKDVAAKKANDASVRAPLGLRCIRLKCRDCARRFPRSFECLAHVRLDAGMKLVGQHLVLVIGDDSRLVLVAHVWAMPHCTRAVASKKGRHYSAAHCCTRQTLENVSNEEHKK